MKMSYSGKKKMERGLHGWEIVGGDVYLQKGESHRQGLQPNLYFYAISSNFEDFIDSERIKFL